ncbi:MAG TPA: hypothetical protein VGY58_17920 [Gemmataceae bacterium]|nr:hypothetical protein [Gemmataceae bacterium]
MAGAAEESLTLVVECIARAAALLLTGARGDSLVKASQVEFRQRAGGEAVLTLVHFLVVDRARAPASAAPALAVRVALAAAGVARVAVSVARVAVSVARVAASVARAAALSLQDEPERGEEPGTLETKTLRLVVSVVLAEAGLADRPGRTL